MLNLNHERNEEDPDEILRDPFDDHTVIEEHEPDELEMLAEIDLVDDSPSLEDQNF